MKKGKKGGMFYLNDIFIIIIHHKLIINYTTNIHTESMALLYTQYNNNTIL